MPLFTLSELNAYLQYEVPEATADLLVDLVDEAILGHPVYGPKISTPPQAGIKGIALEVARRALFNPSNVQAESANGTSVTWNTNVGGRGVALTDTELAKLAAIVGTGRSYGTIRIRDAGLGVWADPNRGLFQPRRSW